MTVLPQFLIVSLIENQKILIPYAKIIYIPRKNLHKL